MANRAVASPEAAFETSNELVPLALGALALLDELAGLLERERVGAAVPSRSDPVLLAALGLLSLRRSLARWLHVAADAAARSAREDREPEATRTGGSFLR